MCMYLWWRSEDRSRDGEPPLDVAEMLSHDGETAALGMTGGSYNTLQRGRGREGGGREGSGDWRH